MDNIATGADLTRGSIPKHLVKFTLPFLLANLLQCIYGTVDSVVLGRFVGDAGITAASNGGQVILVVTALSSGLSTGGTTVISQHFGRKDGERLQKSIATLLECFLCLAIVTTVVILLTCGPLIALLNTPADAVAETKAYLTVSAYGILGVFGYNAVCAMMRGMGNSKGPLYAVAVASVLNVFLDLLFVGKLGMGAAGAALATAVSQGTSFLLAGASLLLGRKIALKMGRSSWRFSTREAGHILRVGLPSACQSFSVRISMMFVLALVNVHGEVAAAAFGIGLKVDNIAQLVRQAVASAMAVMVGQNKGAGQNDRIRSTIRIGGGLNVLLAAAIILFVQIFAPFIAALFIKDGMIIEEAVRYIRIVSLGYFPLALMTAYNSLPIGIGFSEYALLNSFLDSVVARISLCWLFGAILGYGMTGIYVGLALCPIVATLAGCIYFHRGNWAQRQLIKKG